MTNIRSNLAFHLWGIKIICTHNMLFAQKYKYHFEVFYLLFSLKESPKLISF